MRRTNARDEHGLADSCLLWVKAFLLVPVFLVRSLSCSPLSPLSGPVRALCGLPSASACRTTSIAPCFWTRSRARFLHLFVRITHLLVPVP
jgi:hypothetical protein